MVVFELRYDRIMCRRCGDPFRMYGFSCATCGLQPGPSEVNQAVQHRRRLAEAVRLRLDAIAPAQLDAPFHEVADELQARVHTEFSDLMAALSEAASSTRAETTESPLLASAHSIATTRWILKSYQPLRPFAARLELQRAINAMTEDVCRSYLVAFEASTPLEAQQASNMGQEALDRLTAKVGDFGSTLEAVALLDVGDDLAGIIEHLFAALRLRHPGLRATELDNLGRDRFAFLTGRKSAASVGVTVLTTEILAEAHLDVGRWRQVLSEASTLLADSPQFADIAADDTVRRHIRQSSSLALEAFAQLGLLMPRASSDEAVLRQIVKLYAGLFEDLMAPLMVLLLHATGSATRAYDRLLQDDASDIARRVSSSPFASLFAGVEPGYRNANSHGGRNYFLAKRHVVFTLRSFSTSKPVEVVVDDCFALIESLLAVQIAVNNEMLQLGYVDHQPDDLGFFQPTQERMLRWLLEDQGMRVSRLDLQQSVWTVHLKEQPPPLVPIAGGLDSQAPEAVRTFVIENESGGVRNSLSVVRDSFRECLSGDPTEGAWNSTVLLAGCRWDGRPLLADAALRSAVAAVALEALINERADRIPRLRRVRQMAISQTDEEASALLTEAIRALRLRNSASVVRRPEWLAWLDTKALALP